MRTSFWRTAALVGCLGLLITASAHAERQREYQIASDAAEDAGASLVSYNSFDPVGQTDYEQSGSEQVEPAQFVSGGFGGRGGNGFGVGLGFLEQPGQFFFGAEYIYARASFSEALAFVVQDTGAGNPQGGDQFVEYEFDYASSYRFFGGYRVPDCGCEIIFDFAQFQSDASIFIDPTVTQTVFGPYEIDGPQQNFADVDIRSYGIGLARTIPLGGCFCKCDPCCGDACGCGAGCGWCPFWDITWSAGIRFADVGWGRYQTELVQAGTPPALTPNALAFTQLSFDGVGGRVGIGGRRYFGRRRLASIYAKGDISLLVGNMAISTITQGGLTGTNPQPPVFSHRNSARRIIPVTEIEAGASAHLGDHLTLSGGYFISAWHDLGMRDTYDFNRFQLSHYDDANILGFDGFFARAEVAF